MSARALRSPAVWRLPVVMIGLLSVARPAFYLSGITDPQANLRRLPVAPTAGSPAPPLPSLSTTSQCRPFQASGHGR